MEAVFCVTIFYIIINFLLFYPLFISIFFLKTLIFKTPKLSIDSYKKENQLWDKVNIILLSISIPLCIYTIYSYDESTFTPVFLSFYVNPLRMLVEALVPPLFIAGYMILRKNLIIFKDKIFTSPNFRYYLGIGLMLISVSITYISFIITVKEFEACDVCRPPTTKEYNYNYTLFRECKKNCFSISEALELYGEKNNYYPSSLKELQPKYIKSVPSCPAGSYQYRFFVSSDKKSFTMFCSGSNHTDAGFPKDYPLFTGKIKKKNTESKK